MGNVIGSFFSGIANSIGKLLSSPADFLSGKSCSSICGQTWDFFCYIENFCVANLLQMAIALFLSYIVLLCVYLLYKIGMCHCIGHGLCRMLWACVSCWFSFWERSLGFLCRKLLSPRRKRGRHGRVYESTTHDDMNFSGRLASRRRQRHHRKIHLRESLRPKSHRVQIQSRRDPTYSYGKNYGSPLHQIKVTRISKFSHRGENYAHRKGKRRPR